MTWIDDRLAERQKLEDREMLIYNRALPIYGELLTEIGSQIDEAKSKSRDFKGIMRVEGPELEFLFPTKIPPGQSSSMPRKLSLKLKKDRSELTAGEVTFTFDVEGNNVILKHKDKKVTLAEAAILALDPYLFPDLERFDAHSSPEVWKKLAAG